MLLQCRHTSLSNGKLTELRSSALNAARKRVAALTIGATVPPGRFENKFCSSSPSAVMPRNGSRRASRQLANKSCKGLDTLVSSMRGGACNFKEVVTSDMRGFLPRAPKMMKRRPRCAIWQPVLANQTGAGLTCRKTGKLFRGLFCEMEGGGYGTTGISACTQAEHRSGRVETARRSRRSVPAGGTERLG